MNYAFASPLVQAADRNVLQGHNLARNFDLAIVVAIPCADGSLAAQGLNRSRGSGGERGEGRKGLGPT
jgi:hypothetical protein